jgi:hypothetical protein
MKFKDAPKLGFSSGVLQYLQTSLWAWFKDVTVGLRRLNFLDNFQSFEVTDLLIVSGTEAKIPNGFVGNIANAIPSQRIIVRQLGNSVVTDGPTPWNANFVYLSNAGPVDVVITVIFYL